MPVVHSLDEDATAAAVTDVALTSSVRFRIRTVKEKWYEPRQLSDVVVVYGGCHFHLHRAIHSGTATPTCSTWTAAMRRASTCPHRRAYG